MSSVINTIPDSVPDDESGDTPPTNSLSDELLCSIKEATKGHCEDVAKCTANQYSYTGIHKAHLIHLVLHVFYTLGHDGYDCYGPESNLYDVRLLAFDGDQYILEHWHREYWFHGDDISDPFELQAHIETTDEAIVLEFVSKHGEGDIYSFFHNHNSYDN